ncbi:MAG: GDP-mannose 4,6-dehydratase [bacterium]|nr:GDP-mannose 4,6-dehydratase [bacterium]
MRAFITGIAGFAGAHLAEHLARSGWEVAGIERPGAPLDALADAGPVAVTACDILDADPLGRLLANASPDAVFHLAAVSFVPAAERAPRIALDVNVRGSQVVLEACGRVSPPPRVILVSTAEVYGKVPPEEMPLTEDRPPAPANLYAMTKRCAEEVGSYYRRVHALPVVILRPFNHIGPRQNPDFVTSSFARQIAEIEAGARPPVLEVGNIEAARDFTDVRDMVAAYRLAAERDVGGGPYNICTGTPRRIRDVLDRLLALSAVRIEVRPDPSRMRRSEIPLLSGDASRFRRATGWAPSRDLDATLRDILDAWRAAIPPARPAR